MRLIHCLFVLVVIISASSCTIKTIPLKGHYSNGNFEAITDKSREQVWDQLIDLFAKNGLPISVIDKSSGLIVSNGAQLTWTYEDKKGNLVNPNASVVIAKLSLNGEELKGARPALIVGSWNVRIKSVSDKQTMVNINLVNPRITYNTMSTNNTEFNQGSIQSTGNFEKKIFESIK